MTQQAAYLNLTAPAGVAVVVQLVLALILASGFVYSYEWLSSRAFADRDMSIVRRALDRVLLTAMAIVPGFLLYAAAPGFGQGQPLLDTLAFFSLMVALTDRQINVFEYGLRVLTLGAVAMLHYLGDYQNPRFWWTVGMIVVIGVGLRLLNQWVRQKWYVAALYFVVVAALWWLPVSAAPLAMVIQGAANYFVMVAVTIAIWAGQLRAAQRGSDTAWLASYDRLTNESNYEVYRRGISQLFKAAQKDGTPLTMAAVDIDYFRRINERYGHMAGNAVLMGVATTLADIVHRYNPDNRVFRTGGESFTILMPGVTPDEAMPVIRECWLTARQTTYHFKQRDIQVTLSIGVTSVRQDDDDIEQLYQRADDSLYASKHSGRDVITVDGQTQQALTGKPVYATYTFFTQRIADAKGETWAYELLLRCYDYGRKEWIIPRQFNIDPVLQVALIKQLLPELSPKRATINLTRQQFENPQTPVILEEFLQSPAAAGLELIVELPGVPNLKTLQTWVDRYHAAGTKVFIDDVGSDNQYDEVQSALGYVDGMKYAIQNLREAHDVSNLEARLAFWANLARTRNLTFIVEGVENKQDVKWAEETFGAKYLQGYYFGRPELPRIH